MIKRSIARRYARALMDLVTEDHAAVAAQLADFAAAFQGHPELAQVLSNPVFSLEERRRVLKRLQAVSPLHAPLDRFIDLLVARHRLAYLGAVAECFGELVDEREGRVRVVVESAAALEAPARAQLEAALVASLGQKVVLETRVAPALLAGVQLRVGGLVLDGSLRGQLERLKERLARRKA
ncbi:MAG TPA: ATP synthase F1 subunit delta [Myxococcota bacterium]|nr:ATP synthase F1 subunit delta [Myxococcota bacterium]HRY96696.1 ATP synthase F1 subunit delta [Myxococcota bacterium]HSA20216.1 ATP synthase F1 subunit delta [Myxococcota bacterium]